MVKHIVMWKFKDGKEAEMNYFLTELKKLENQIDEIKSMQIGVSLKENNDYDAILISEFATMKDVKKYKEDPRHVKVSSFCKEIRQSRTSIDFEE